MFLPSDMNPGCLPAMRFMSRYQIPTKMKTGSTQEMMSRRNVDSILPLKVTLYCSRIFESSGSTRTVLKSSRAPWAFFILPWISPWEMAISVTLPCLRKFMNWL